jgi:hypothetical protein
LAGPTVCLTLPFAKKQDRLVYWERPFVYFEHRLLVLQNRTVPGT